MDVPAFHVNAFVGAGAAGNPAAVVSLPPAIMLSDHHLQRIAAQFGLSETAFAQPVDETAGAARFRLRWFTPTKEVALCGHATLATAHALWTQCKVSAEKLIFSTLSGDLLVERGSDALMMRFPLNEPGSSDGRPSPAAAVYRTLAEIAVGAALAPCIAELAHNKRTGKLIVRLADPSDGSDAAPTSAAEADAMCEGLAAMPRPDPAVLLAVDQSALAACERVSGISVTCAGSAAARDAHISDSSASVVVSPLRRYGAHFASRYFSPWNGLPEDPVNGSSHTILCPFWVDRLRLRGADGQPLTRLTAVQLSRRPAGGVLQVSLHRISRSSAVGMASSDAGGPATGPGGAGTAGSAAAEGAGHAEGEGEGEGWVGIGGAASTLWSGAIKVPI